MRRQRRDEPDRARVRDRHGRTWTITVTTPEEDDDLAPWIDMTPEERLDVIGECVLDGLRLRGELELPRFRRIYRVMRRTPRTRKPVAVNGPRR